MCLADISNSFAVNFQVYTGRGPDGQREQHQGARVVRDLTSVLQGGYSITTDNFFTGVELAKELKQKNCTLLGTMRQTKTDVPPALREIKGRPVHSSKFLHHEGLTIVSYIPKKHRNVVLLSSQHQGAKIEGQEHDFKPQMILDYNKTNGAVDTLDKLVREYRCLRTSRRWPLALFFDFIDIAGYNAFCAWSDHEPNYNIGKSHRLFLMQLAEDLMKPLIDARARNPVGIQEPILAAINMFVPVEHRVARHIRAKENKAIGRCAICARGQDRKNLYKQFKT